MLVATQAKPFLPADGAKLFHPLEHSAPVYASAYKSPCKPLYHTYEYHYEFNTPLQSESRDKMQRTTLEHSLPPPATNAYKSSGGKSKGGSRIENLRSSKSTISSREQSGNEQQIERSKKDPAEDVAEPSPSYKLGKSSERHGAQCAHTEITLEKSKKGSRTSKSKQHSSQEKRGLDLPDRTKSKSADHIAEDVVLNRLSQSDCLASYSSSGLASTGKRTKSSKGSKIVKPTKTRLSIEKVLAEQKKAENSFHRRNSLPGTSTSDDWLIRNDGSNSTTTSNSNSGNNSEESEPLSRESSLTDIPSELRKQKRTHKSSSYIVMSTSTSTKSRQQKGGSGGSSIVLGSGSGKSKSGLKSSKSVGHGLQICDLVKMSNSEYKRAQSRITSASSESINNKAKIAAVATSTDYSADNRMLCRSDNCRRDDDNTGSKDTRGSKLKKKEDANSVKPKWRFSISMAYDFPFFRSKKSTTTAAQPVKGRRASLGGSLIGEADVKHSNKTDKNDECEVESSEVDVGKVLPDTSPTGLSASCSAISSSTSKRHHHHRRRSGSSGSEIRSVSKRHQRVMKKGSSTIEGRKAREMRMNMPVSIFADVAEEVKTVQKEKSRAARPQHPSEILMKALQRNDKPLRGDLRVGFFRGSPYHAPELTLGGKFYDSRLALMEDPRFFPTFSRLQPENKRPPVLTRSSSTSTLFVHSTLYSADYSEAMRCVATAYQMHVQYGHKSNAYIPQDIFSEIKYPLCEGDSVTEVPTVDEIFKFITRIYESEDLSIEIAIMALIYIERVVTLNGVVVAPSNWRRLLLCATILASKVWEELAVWNSDFLSLFPLVGTKDLFQMEIAFLTMLKFSLAVPAPVYLRYYFDLISISPRKPLLDKKGADQLEKFASIETNQKRPRVAPLKRVESALGRAMPKQSIPHVIS